MKTKGITIWEQHIERIVLAVAVLVFIGFTAKQFIGNPNAADWGREKVSPGDVDERLREMAAPLAARLSDPQPTIDPPQPRSIASVFADQMVASVSTGQTLRPMQLPMRTVTKELDPTGVVFVVPEIPSPGVPQTEQYLDALTETVVAQIAELQPLFPQPPHDATWITPVTTFPVAEILSQYRGENAAEDETKIPESWYHDRVDIVDVVCQRQESVDGQWTNEVILDPLPGRFTLRSELAGEIDRTTGDQMLDALARPVERDDIIQPPFYDTLNESWSPPEMKVQDDVATTETPEQKEIRTLQRQRTRARATRKDILRRLEKVGGPVEEGGEGGGAGGGGGMGGGGGDLPGRKKPPGAGGGKRDDTRLSEERKKRIREKLSKDLEEIDRRIATIDARLAQLLGANDADTADADSDEILVWTHDLTVQPGSTYRYRFKVRVFNPFFARKLNLVKEQEREAEAFTRDSEFSQWSEPVTVEPMLRVFITSATAMDQGRQGATGAVGQMALGQATAKVFRFFEGRQWAETFHVQPGDRIGEPRTRRGPDGQPGKTIDFTTNWIVLDIVSLVDVDATALANRGKAAEVWLQQTEGPATVVRRDPRQDARNPDLDKLEQQKQAAEEGPEQPADA